MMSGSQVRSVRNAANESPPTTRPFTVIGMRARDLVPNQRRFSRSTSAGMASTLSYQTASFARILDQNQGNWSRMETAPGSTVVNSGRFQVCVWMTS